jgi:hypothetical protein
MVGKVLSKIFSAKTIGCPLVWIFSTLSNSSLLNSSTNQLAALSTSSLNFESALTDSIYILLYHEHKFINIFSAPALL